MTKLPDKIRQAAEAAADEHFGVKREGLNPFGEMQYSADSFHNLERNRAKRDAYLTGWSDCHAHLLTKAPEFDYAAMDAELFKYLGRLAKNTELLLCKHIARWQHAQMAASVQAMNATVSLLKDQNEQLNAQLSEANAQVQALREENEQLKWDMKATEDVYQMNRRYVEEAKEEIERLKAELATQGEEQWHKGYDAAMEDSRK